MSRVRIPYRLWAGRLLCNPAFGRALRRVFDGRVPSRGVSIRVDSPAIRDEIVASIFWGLYERTEVGCVLAHLPRDVDVVELGASIGVVSRHIGRVLEPERRLVCVEANPRLVSVLAENARRGDPAGPVAIVNAAVHYEASQVAFALDDGNLGSAIARGGENHTVSLPAVTLARLVDQHALRAFTLVADIEGAELAMFLDDGGLIAASCDTIIAELHATEHRGRRYGVEDVLGVVEALGYAAIYRRNDVFVFRRSPAPA